MDDVDQGHLTRRVLAYEHALKGLVPHVTGPKDWAPLVEFVAVDEFERVGAFLEVQTWEQYTEMLTLWASTIAKLETSVKRISELPGVVYFEIEERHFRGDTVSVGNSLTVFEFDDDSKIRRLRVYLQQPR
jgi:hypothetical protein